MRSWKMLTGVWAMVVATVPAFADEKAAPKALNFKMKTIQGKDVDLTKYQGQVVLFVNVASQCGLTPQYEQLQKLHEKYSSKGLSIVGVPCNQFGGQEPGTEEEISEFCKANYGVSFDLLSKVDVNGENACDLYKHLTGLNAKPKGAGKVSWNFEKFLIGRDGSVVARFEPKIKPDDPDLIKALEGEIAKKK